jgi:hypothetical protein
VAVVDPDCCTDLISLDALQQSTAANIDAISNDEHIGNGSVNSGLDAIACGDVTSGSVAQKSSSGDLVNETATGQWSAAVRGTVQIERIHSDSWSSCSTASVDDCPTSHYVTDDIIESSSISHSGLNTVVELTVLCVSDESHGDNNAAGDRMIDDAKYMCTGDDRIVSVVATNNLMNDAKVTLLTLQRQRRKCCVLQ